MTDDELALAVAYARALGCDCDVEVESDSPVPGMLHWSFRHDDDCALLRRAAAPNN